MININNKSAVCHTIRDELAVSTSKRIVDAYTENSSRLMRYNKYPVIVGCWFVALSTAIIHRGRFFGRRGDFRRWLGIRDFPLRNSVQSYTIEAIGQTVSIRSETFLICQHSGSMSGGPN